MFWLLAKLDSSVRQILGGYYQRKRGEQDKQTFIAGQLRSLTTH